jgi:hypothetical protein
VHSVLVLEDAELIPVLELEPSVFATDERPLPSGLHRDQPQEWHRYWLESLADSGITGLAPVQDGSWHIPTTEFTEPALLRRVLEAIFRNLSERGLFDQPDDLPLDGGLALRSQSRNVLIQPACCADLGNVADWRKAVGYRQAEWQTLWIGHPWLLVQYQAPRLIISDSCQGNDPTTRWAVCPDQLQVALVAAEIELERFAGQIAGALPSRYEADARRIGRRLAGLNE